MMTGWTCPKCEQRLVRVGGGRFCTRCAEFPGRPVEKAYDGDGCAGCTYLVGVTFLMWVVIFYILQRVL